MYTLVPLENQLEVTHVVTAFEKVRPTGYVFAGEMHDFWEMTYVLEGTVTVSAEDHVMTLPRRRAVFYQPMEFHSLRCSGDTDARILVVSFAARGKVMETFRGRVMDLSLDDEGLLRSAVQELSTYLVSPEDTMRGARGKAMLESLLWQLSMRPTPTMECHPAAGSRIYEQAMRVLNEHVREALTLSDVARMCKTSESSLKKAFAAYAHTGVMHCFNSIKIRLAAQLLVKGMSAAAVSEALSFSSPSYFHVAFRREMHCTPGQYAGSRRRR